MECIFCKIVEGEIPADFVYESENVVAFRDINPQAPTHILVVPRKHIDSVEVLEDDNVCLMGELIFAAKKVAAKLGISSGYRLIVNNGSDGGQEIDHIHLHLLAGRKMAWPPG
ncbi:MAG: histidine triad nucleotide-binding protein [Candidatus Marinimicrobia bacterium]|nr:histidine triad nucleotide-binding protein [Candidatus Neomarinimicrobiota bacterium]